MASYTVEQVANETLTGATVDDVTVEGGWPAVEVVNRDAAEALWVTVGTGEAPDDPAVAGDNVLPVMPSERVVVYRGRRRDQDLVVKLIGDGNAYSVIGVT